jgi:rubrerythrin
MIWAEMALERAGGLFELNQSWKGECMSENRYMLFFRQAYKERIRQL